MATKEEMLKELSDCVFDMRDDESAEICEKWLAEGYDAREGIFEGLVDGMNRAAKLFEEEEYFIPELLICSDAMYNGLEVLRPHIDKAKTQSKCKVAIGVVEGDTHDIGKNLVKIMLEASGYEMIDLGRDVPPAEFVKTARENDCKLIALSTLMSTSMENMGRVVDGLTEAGIRDQAKVIIGGGPLSQGYADKIGADGYSDTATEAVKLADALLGY